MDAAGRHHGGEPGPIEGIDIGQPVAVLERFAGNGFLKDGTSAAIEHFGTQGDGNHFVFVGRVASWGRIALATHHGSRKPAAHNAWLEADTREGESFRDALHSVRDWTKAGPFAIHDRIAEAPGLRRGDRFWNEHTFVFRRSDGLFYHAEGATPAYRGFAADDSGLTLIPLDMVEPILVAEGVDAAHGLGFAPHGAGRNFSRSADLRQNAGRTPAEMVAEQIVGIDARVFCGVPDASELPGADERAASLRRQIDGFGLARVVDTVEPVGCIMAGDWQADAPWRRTGRGRR